MESINVFSGEFRWLSNFFPSQIDDGERIWPTVEHRFQALKTLDHEAQEAIRFLETPGKAKRAGRKIKIRSGWHLIRIDVMRDCLRMKFAQNPVLRQKLIDTGESFLMEGNTWGDTFWGVDLKTGEGANKLGFLLMEIRGEIC